MTRHKHIGTAARSMLVLALSLCLAQSICQAQQDYVGRYDLYTGFSDLYTPALNDLNQVGFHLQAGMNNTRWLATGFDYSVQSGSTSLTSGLATKMLQEELATELPPGYVLNIPVDITTQTFTVGSQLEYRHFSKVTFFVRPSLAAFRLAATPHPSDPIGALVAAQLVPQGEKVDWVGTYGFGGGAELLVSRHLALRMQYDGIWNHPYNDILGSGNWTSRFSVGPAFHFGRNVPDHSRK